jgi:hypothetical protein
MQINNSENASTVSKTVRSVAKGTKVPFWAFRWFIENTRRASKLKLVEVSSAVAISLLPGVLL